MGAEARKDLVDIERADIFVLYNPLRYQRMGTGGRHVEMGYALARDKRIIVIGEIEENVFQQLDEVTFLVWDYHNHMSMLADALALMVREITDAKLRQGSGTV